MSLPALLLHQYDTSPFSEKIRKIFAHKRLAWGAVEQPSIMPKPELVPLTGGYRRIPVLQIGADVYCDTQLIARVLERRHPEPTIFPDGGEATAQAWNLWADRLLFMPVVAVVFADIGQFVPKAFMDDRSKMMPGRSFDDVPKPGTARARAGARAARDRRGAARATAARGCSAPRSAWRMPPATIRCGSSASAPGGQALLAEFSRVARLDGVARGDGPGRPPRRRGGRRARAGARRGAGDVRPASIRASRTVSPPARR